MKQLQLHKNLSRLLIVTAVFLGLLGIGNITASATNKKPYWGTYDTRRITYYSYSKTKHYKGVWNYAIKQWNKQKVVKLVKVKKVNDALIELDTAAPKRNTTEPYLTENAVMGDVPNVGIGGFWLTLNRTYFKHERTSLKNQKSKPCKPLVGDSAYHTIRPGQKIVSWEPLITLLL
ncbi:MULTISPECIES: hypothetical protein [Levilactobacillus]|uniref:hypothetical protein n=1 Tax=Levilactobacillus TaxID=2767886 RepID=UPI00194FFB88|nr:hypothetical protein [Levilactobacillus sp. 244-2]